MEFSTHWQRMRRKLSGVPSFMMQPELTNYCNFTCKFCPHSVYRDETASGNRFDRDKGFMSDELMDIFIGNARKYAKAVTLGFFGEPMLHPKFAEFARRLSENRNYHLVLFSNFSLATQANMESLNVFDTVNISIDASYPELYDEILHGLATSELVV